MFATSTQRREWVFSSAEALQAQREKTWAATIAKFQAQQRLTPFSTDMCLTCAEELELVRHFLCDLKTHSKKFKPNLPLGVIATASAFAMRYFLQNTVMDFPPYRVFNVALFLACKAEEINVPLRGLLVALSYPSAEEVAFTKEFELEFLKGIRFHMTVHSGFRPLKGFLADWQAFAHDDSELVAQLEAPARAILLDWLSSDVALLYPPSKIALAALAQAALQVQQSIVPFIKRICSLRGETPDAVKNPRDLEKELEAIQRCARETSVGPSPERAKQLLEKLAKCSNPFLNPASAEFKLARATKAKKRAGEEGVSSVKSEKKGKFEEEDEL